MSADALALLDAQVTADHPEPPAWLMRVTRLICCPSCQGRTEPPIWVADHGWVVPWPHDRGCPDAGTPLPLRDPFKEW